MRTGDSGTRVTIGTPDGVPLEGEEEREVVTVGIIVTITRGTRGTGGGGTLATVTADGIRGTGRAIATIIENAIVHGRARPERAAAGRRLHVVIEEITAANASEVWRKKEIEMEGTLATIIRETNHHHVAKMEEETAEMRGTTVAAVRGNDFDTTNTNTTTRDRGHATRSRRTSDSAERKDTRASTLACLLVPTTTTTTTHPALPLAPVGIVIVV